jgi:DNA-directed RNA polymerase specialized sigma24 family protein
MRDSQTRGGDNAQFNTTHWTVLLQAREGLSPAAEEARARLCREYWYPLYAFIRRQGHSPEEAQDLTQGYFAHLLETHALATVDRSKGRFRSFLLASLRHFLGNCRVHAAAQKRGGGCILMSLDGASAEARYGLEPVESASPDTLFERN